MFYALLQSHRMAPKTYLNRIVVVHFIQGSTNILGWAYCKFSLSCYRLSLPHLYVHMHFRCIFLTLVMYVPSNTYKHSLLGG